MEGMLTKQLIWAEEESLPRQEIEKIQLKRLQETVAYIYERVPYYREKMEKAGVRPQDLKSLEDIRLFPVTTKDDFRINYPYGLFAVPLEKMVRIHASSGTTGKPVVVGYTKKDLETWAELVARMATMAGTTAGDIAQISFGYGLFTGAFGLHYGLEKIGALVVPLSSGNTQRQLELMQDFGVTVLVSTPSYAMYLAEEAQKSGIETDKLSLRLGLFGAEPSTAEFRKVLAKKWGITATHNYGLSEVMGPGVAGECTFLCGMHINEDYFLVEALDPKTLEPVPPGEEGELVITPLAKEGLPLLRYRTRDIASLTYEPCPCGRTTARIKKIKGRSDDMLIIRGVNVFPSQVETVLLEVEGVSPNYRIIVKREGYLDVMEIEVEIDESHFTDRFRDLKKIKENVEEKLYNVLNLHIPVRLLEAGSLPRSVGKAQRIVDLRKEE